jgi:putative solute:sodium symporter small subunit
MQLTQNHIDYWHKNLRLTAILLVVWFIATFVVAWYAIPLGEIKMFGWPLSFYMAAQGSLIIYVLIIAFYAVQMRKYDEEHGVHEGEED